MGLLTIARATTDAANCGLAQFGTTLMSMAQIDGARIDMRLLLEIIPTKWFLPKARL